jgi:hypothetical protein
MDAAPDGVRPSMVELEPMLGAVPGEADLGPISPELALVDPDLAQRARQLLPEPEERPRSRPPVAPPEPLAEPAVVPPAPSAPPPRRWRRTVVLAGLVFAAGAASGGYLGEQHAAVPEVTLGVQAGAPTTTAPPGSEKQALTHPSLTVSRPALRPPKVTAKNPRSPSRRARRQRRQPARVIWAANVLGVTARVGGPGVTLVWQRPADSGRVVVVRKRSHARRGAVVFRGRGTSYRDRSPRPCAAYRYTIVNFDRSGHRSTGVPTSVVTGGCT